MAHRSASPATKEALYTANFVGQLRDTWVWMVKGSKPAAAVTIAYNSKCAQQ